MTEKTKEIIRKYFVKNMKKDWKFLKIYVTILLQVVNEYGNTMQK